MGKNQIGPIEAILTIIFFIAFSIGGVWLSYNCQTENPIIKSWCDFIGKFSWFILVVIILLLIAILIAFFWVIKKYR